ncbi:glycosyltransferase involved in cell wall biosynthesis [Rhodopirellula rubra]|uniref:Glycosyltransferase involved in cell wall biosynthesis n=1 Tax=Aporhodopirellula rubra TaxID=980271 RepID=A0A7W5DY06_9BACT|nr:glycosyltransferase family 4 protein [Aporhodopirellula rubra]MBB3206262.1 glycosyltransferase involved in cell wall biosynthesis [Aporhodopirellula rubra]
MSGNHVVYGFLRPYAAAILPNDELLIVHYEDNPPPQEILDQGATTIPVSARYQKWSKRLLWESTRLPSVILSERADVVLTVSGALTPRCPVPQAVLCQNPWCYRPVVHRDWKERIKARLQRVGYRKAFEKADLMIYISGHLRDLYRQDNLGRGEAPSEIAYVGLNDDTYAAAQQHADLPRDPYSILSVSAMASWKGAHTLVEAVSILRKRDIPAILRLVGPWPHPEYEQRIRRQIQSLGLDEAVEILGRVSDEELHRQYAINQVYALPSHCESYGIPAAEAMAFGTPVVSTTCCAIAEICAEAGEFGPVENPNWTADALQKLLCDQNRWNELSAAAKQKAATLNWQTCYQPLLKLSQLATSN